MLIYRGKRFNTVVRFIILTIVVSCPLTICPRFGLCKDAVEKPSTAFEGLTTAPWRSGEKAVYSISMSGIEIAIARTSIGAFDSDRIVARVASETLPSFSNILRVKDDISSWILLDGLMPERSEIHAIYKKNESRTYNELTRTKAGIRLKQRIAAWLPSKNSALEKKKRTWKTATRYPTLLHDPVSLLLNLRHKVLKTGERYSYFVMSGRKKYLVVLNVQGNETIYLNGRAVKTMRLLGTMQRTSGARKLRTLGKSRAFSMWLEKTGARRALRASVSSPLGQMKMELRQSFLGEETVQASGAPAILPKKLLEMATGTTKSK